MEARPEIYFTSNHGKDFTCNTLPFCTILTIFMSEDFIKRVYGHH